MRLPRPSSGRTIKAAVAAVAAASLLLSACGSDDVASDRQSTLASVELDITGSGTDREAAFSWGGEPFAEADEAYAPITSETRVIAEGEGTVDEEEDRVSVHYALLNGSTGELIVSTLADEEPVTFSIGAQANLPPGLLSALETALPGSELLLSLPANDAFGPAGSPELGIGGGDAILMYVEVVDRFVHQLVLPTVDADGETPAEVTIPAGEEPPSELIVEILQEGDGEVTQAGDSISVHYTGVSWDTGETFDSSLGEDRGEPFVVEGLGTAPVIDGWNEGLQDVPVGSQVLLIIPPAQAYGFDSSVAPLAGQTLVFVVDVLEIVG